LYLVFIIYLYLYGPWLANEQERALEQYRALIQQVAELQNKASVCETQAGVWHELLNNRRSAHGLFKDLERLLPLDTWLTRVAVSTPEAPPSPGPVTGLQAPDSTVPLPTAVVIEGESYSLASVGVFTSKLSDLPYFVDVNLKTVQESGSGQPPVSVFVIEAAYNKGGRQ
jgi:Tfp pilus assembly protein PilN